ncbi:MAG: signal peptidase II [Proteobacteria bacterium]|nr:signal peptidase II [Pseudomonadota bacterium]
MLREKFTRKYQIFFIALPLILFWDQVTKYLVRQAVPIYGSIPVIEGFFSITHVKNTGAAFGLFAGGVSPFRTLFFMAITVGAVIVILLIFRRIRGDRILAPLSLAMIMAGALGNLVDRIRWGYVIDFLDLYWREYHWPAFNVADSAITVAVFLLFIENLFLHKNQAASEGLAQRAR